MKQSPKNLLWSFAAGLGMSSISYISGFLMMIHTSGWPSTYWLLDVSFFHFTPLVSWMLLFWAFTRWSEKRFRNLSIRRVLALFFLLLALSPLIRTFDILLDFTIKYVIGWTSASPFTVLNQVWLVVLSTSPMAFFKMLVIIGLVYFQHFNRHSFTNLVLKATDGSLFKLNQYEIMYIQADGNYLIIQSQDATIRSRDTLKSFKLKLADAFVQIHRSTIINPHYVKQCRHWRNGEYLVIMADGKSLSSSRTYKSSMDDMIRGTSRPTFHPELQSVHHKWA